MRKFILTQFLLCLFAIPLAAIAIQKWIALCNFNGLEAWAEYRRTEPAGSGAF